MKIADMIPTIAAAMCRSSERNASTSVAEKGTAGDFGDGAAYPLIERGLIVAFAELFGVESFNKIGRSRQAAGMGGGNSPIASFHEN